MQAELGQAIFVFWVMALIPALVHRETGMSWLAIPTFTSSFSLTCALIGVVACTY